MEKGKNGTMAQFAKTYTKNMTERIENLLETKPRSWDTTRAEIHYPELDETTAFLQCSDISKYKMIIGC